MKKTDPSNLTERWIICMTLALSLIAVSLLHGLPQELFRADQTNIVWGIFCVLVIGSFSSRWMPEVNNWLCEHGVTILIGLLGTVIGFMAAIGGIAEGSNADKMSGIQTSLSTTIVGLISHLYLIFVQRIVR